MEELNPKPPAEVLAAQEEEAFLSGGDARPDARNESRPTGGHRH